MGFDKGRKPTMILSNVSDTRAYKAFGNSVVVPVVEAVARHMKAHIIEQLERSKGALVAAAPPKAKPRKAVSSKPKKKARGRSLKA